MVSTDTPAALFVTNFGAHQASSMLDLGRMTIEFLQIGSPVIIEA